MSAQFSDRTKLASNFTVAQYRVACGEKNTDVIADALHRRFQERYILPVKEVEIRHGFTIMAISCLTIEALESFRQGWKDSKGKSEKAFEAFFNRHPQFASFKGSTFYKNVRCGILHQAETTGGWKITRKRSIPLFDSGSRTINARLFLASLSDVLDDYRDQLKKAAWDSPEWVNARKKFKALCDNCSR